MEDLLIRKSTADDLADVHPVPDTEYVTVIFAPETHHSAVSLILNVDLGLIVWQNPALEAPLLYANCVLALVHADRIQARLERVS